MPRVLSTTTCLHVALLVYLRMVTITRPFSYKDTHIKLRHISIVVIWVVSVIICFLPVLASYFNQEEFYDISRIVLLHGFHSIPVICIIIMYGKLSWTIASHKGISGTKGRREITNQRPNLMIKRIVLCLVVCYLPYLSLWEYAYSVVGKRDPCVIYKFEVHRINN